MIKRIVAKRWSSIVMSFFALVLTFIAGAFSANTRLEAIADYAANVVKNDTRQGKYACVSVGKTEESGPIPNPNNEFNNLYGIFRQNKITFASSINADKKQKIFFDDIITDNLSLLYIGPTGTIKYNGHYKHGSSPMELMFEDIDTYDVGRFKAYISQTHAKKILEQKKNATIIDQSKEYSESDYKSLIKTIVPMSINGRTFDFVIQNIYYQLNYYYDGLTEVMGDFILTSYYLPLNLRDIQRNMYFMSEYAYQNKYFMDYINAAYYGKRFDVQLNDYNLIHQVDTLRLTSFYYDKDATNTEWVSIILFFISSAILLVSVLIVSFNFGNKYTSRFYLLFLNFIALLIPYFIFKTIAYFTKNIIFFSGLSTRFTFFAILAYLLIFVFLLIARRFKKTINTTTLLNYYEFDL